MGRLFFPLARLYFRDTPTSHINTARKRVNTVLVEVFGLFGLGLLEEPLSCQVVFL